VNNSTTDLGRCRLLELLDLGGLELPCWNFLLKQDVQLSVRPAFGLGQSEESPDQTDSSGSGPKVTGLGTKVPFGRVQHVRVEDTDNDTTDVVQVSSEDDSLGPQSSRSDLSDERVTNGTNGNVVDEGEEDEETTNTVLSTLGGSVDCTQDSGNQHDANQDTLSVEVKISSTERLHEEPRRCGSNTTDDEHDQVEGGSSRRRETGGGKEVGSGTHERRSRDGLDEPNDTGDFGSSEINTLETIPVRGTDLSLEFELIGVVHHGNFLLGEIGGDTSDQLVDGSFGILESSLSGQPPRRLGSEQDTDENGNGPDPLDGKGDLVCPLGSVVDQSSVNTADQFLTMADVRMGLTLMR
jgi:hypothetical protein